MYFKYIFLLYYRTQNSQKYSKNNIYVLDGKVGVFNEWKNVWKCKKQNERT